MNEVALLRRVIGALNEGGVEAALEFFDPKVEWETTGMFVEADTYRGHDGIRSYMGALFEEFEDLKFELAEVIRDGNPLAYKARLRVVGRHSRAPVEIELFIVADIRNGKVLRQRNFRTREEALAVLNS